MSQERRAHARTVVYRAEEPGEREIYEVEYESVADALHFACRDLRTGRRRPVEILEDGTQIYDAAGIAGQCEHNATIESLEAVVEDQAERTSG